MGLKLHACDFACWRAEKENSQQGGVRTYSRWLVAPRHGDRKVGDEE